MKSTLFRLAGAAICASGMLLAQTQASPGEAAPPAQHRQWNRGPMFDTLAAKLNLTDAQKQQAQSILGSARESSKSIAQQLRQARHGLWDAIKAGKSDAEIDQLSANMGNLTGQLTAIRTKAFARVYALLTPEQRIQTEQLRDRVRGMFMGGHERGPGARGGF
jgi:Spy/CpxP family protein refolding chaperone